MMMMKHWQTIFSGSMVKLLKLLGFLLYEM